MKNDFDILWNCLYFKYKDNKKVLRKGLYKDLKSCYNTGVSLNTIAEWYGLDNYFTRFVGKNGI